MTNQPINLIIKTNKETSLLTNWLYSLLRTVFVILKRKHWGRTLRTKPGVSEAAGCHRGPLQWVRRVLFFIVVLHLLVHWVHYVYDVARWNQMGFLVHIFQTWLGVHVLFKISFYSHRHLCFWVKVPSTECYPQQAPSHNLKVFNRNSHLQCAFSEAVFHFWTPPSSTGSLPGWGSAF